MFPKSTGMKNYQTEVDRFWLTKWHWHRQRLTECWWSSANGFCCVDYLLCCGRCVQSAILSVARKCLFVSELSNADITRRVFVFDYNFDRLNLAWQFESRVAVCLLSFWAWRISCTQIFHKIG